MSFSSTAVHATRRCSCYLATVCLLAGLQAVCQSPISITQLVSLAAENFGSRSKRADDFTYSERVQNINYDASGKMILKVADTYKIVFLQGAPYRIHDAHNDRALSEGDQKKELRKAMDAAQDKASGRAESHSTHNVVLAMPIPELTYQFNYSSRGEKEIRGRQTMHVHATPKPNYSAKTQQEELANAIELDLWIDEQDVQIARLEAHVVSAGTMFHIGTFIQQEFVRQGDNVWLPERLLLRGAVQDGRKEVLAETEQTYSHYERFLVHANDDLKP